MGTVRRFRLPPSSPIIPSTGHLDTPLHVLRALTLLAFSSAGNPSLFGLDEGKRSLTLRKIGLSADEDGGVLDEDLVHILEGSTSGLWVKEVDNREVRPADDSED